ILLIAFFVARGIVGYRECGARRLIGGRDDGSADPENQSVRSARFLRGRQGRYLDGVGETERWIHFAWALERQLQLAVAVVPGGSRSLGRKGSGQGIGDRRCQLVLVEPVAVAPACG